MIPLTGNRAITFLELLLVTVVIGILIGISIPNFRKTFNSLQLNSFARDLQSFMNYLYQRSIVEEQIVTLSIDNEKKEYWAKSETDTRRLKTYRIPDEIKIETEEPVIIFYPDGTIDKATLKIIDSDSQSVTLTTEGVFGGVKLQNQQ